MVERSRFGREELLDVLREVSTGLERRVEALLIGGLAMMHWGMKVTTKDVDILFTDEVEERAFEGALGSLGFVRAQRLSERCTALGATTVMERPDGMRFDVFVGVVCAKLRLTEGMRRRADELPLDGNLRLMAAAPEDLFLFKSVTDREDDLADMALLAGAALDWERRWPVSSGATRSTGGTYPTTCPSWTTWRSSTAWCRQGDVGSWRRRRSCSASTSWRSASGRPR